MYSTCLFCNHGLGSNEAIEAFPVGRRLAFDQQRGRLWVVCRHCEKWNLTPLEERWDAIESCEQSFRDTRKRVSTDNIGLARLSEGLELVRIGDPQRPEFAAWRYGDQFGRRHRRAVLIGAATGTMLVGMTLMGLVGTAIGGTAAVLGTSANAALQWGQLVQMARRRRRAIARVNAPGGDRVTIRGADYLHLVADRRSRAGWFVDLHFQGGKYSLEGDIALRAMAAILPHLNVDAGSKGEVSSAVQRIEDSGSPEHFLKWLAGRPGEQEPYRLRRWAKSPVGLHHLGVEMRLALEMAVNEESEHRALEGELALLELAWRDAEEIAAIADKLLVPADIEASLLALRRR